MNENKSVGDGTQEIEAQAVVASGQDARNHLLPIEGNGGRDGRDLLGRVEEKIDVPILLGRYRDAEVALTRQREEGVVLVRRVVGEEFAMDVKLAVEAEVSNGGEIARQGLRKVLKVAEVGSDGRWGDGACVGDGE